MRELAAEKLQPDLLRGDAGWEDSARVSDAQLWEVLREMRSQLVDDVRDRLCKSWQERGASPAALGWIDEVLDPDALTIGFARRVPTYKRLTLMLRGPERLKAALSHRDRPVQRIPRGECP